MHVDRTHIAAGDPLGEGTAALDAARSRMRQTVLSHVVAEPSRRATPPIVPRRIVQAVALAAAVLLVLLATTVSRVWAPSGSSIVEAAQVRFEVRLAETAAAAGLDAATLDDGRVVHLHRQVLATNADVAQAVVEQHGGFYGVRVELTQAAAARLTRATAAHIGKPVAILLDGRLVLAPTLRSPIGDSAVISGTYTQETAQRLAAGIARH